MWGDKDAWVLFVSLLPPQDIYTRTVGKISTHSSKLSIEPLMLQNGTLQYGQKIKNNRGTICSFSLLIFLGLNLFNETKKI